MSVSYTIPKTDNYYLFFSRKQLLNIAEEREIWLEPSIAASYNKLVEYLFEYDKVCTVEFQNILNFEDKSDLPLKSSWQAIIIAHHNGIDISFFNHNELKLMGRFLYYYFINDKITFNTRRPLNDAHQHYTTIIKSLPQYQDGYNTIIWDYFNPKEISLSYEYPLEISMKDYVLLKDRIGNATDVMILVLRYIFRRTVFTIPENLLFDELVFIFSRGYLPPNWKDIMKSQERYKQLTTIPDDKLSTVIGLYGLTISNREFLSRLPEHPFEYLLITMNENSNASVDNVIKIMGLVVPPYVDKLNYLNSSVMCCSQLMIEEKEEFISIRNPPDCALAMHTYTDKELIDIFDILINYSSRLELIVQLERSRRLNMFFVPCHPDRAVNKETSLFTDVTNDNNELIGYGLYNSFTCFEIDELLVSFHHPKDAVGDDNKLDFVFLNPQNGKRFSQEDVEQLLMLLQIGYHMNREKRRILIDHITKGMKILKEIDALDGRIKKLFDSLCEQYKDFKGKFHTLLIILFETGMYMRRWKGHGTPFPMKEDDTHGDDSHYINSSKGIKIIIETVHNDLNVYKLFSHLRKIIFGRTEMVGYNEPFERTFDLVRSDKLCMRIGSSSFIGTSHHYLKTFYKEAITGFNPYELDEIS